MDDDALMRYVGIFVLCAAVFWLMIWYSQRPKPIREGLSDKKINQIRSEIKLHCSPRHVPEKIIQIKEIPYTINGKKVEIAVKRIIQGEDVKNRDALIAPQVLSYYENIPELLD